MKTDLLLKLADLLDTVPPERFDYEFWFKKKAIDNASPPVAGECGTTACALGWATTMPETRLSLGTTRGLFPREQFFVDHPNRARFQREDFRSDFPLGFEMSIASARAAFDLSHDDAMLLFIPGQWHDGQPSIAAGPKEVAAWIRTVVRRHLDKESRGDAEPLQDVHEGAD